MKQELCAILLALWLAVTCSAALTERYVTVDSDGGDGTSGDPWTLTEAFANAVAGDRVNVGPGTYVRTASDTPGASGSSVDGPIIYRGYKTSIGDLADDGRSAAGELVTADFPVIAYDAGYGLTASSLGWLQLETLSITASLNGKAVDVGGQCALVNCYVLNDSTGAAAYGVELSGSNSLVYNCDLKLTGASGGVAALHCEGSNNRALFTRIRGSQADGIKCSGTAHIVAFCQIKGVADDGIVWASSNATQTITVLCNTIISTGDGIETANYAIAALPVFIDNHITDCGAYGINNGYAGTAAYGAFFGHNRTRDNVSGAVNGFGDYPLHGHVTTDTGGAATDYTGAGSTPFDLTLIADAPAKAAGTVPYLDIGALQRQEPAGSAGGRTFNEGFQN